ncbi:MAG: Uma2 family endonuclease [Candidatus Electrothrix sp. Rat3]|nr:Uma2 family endonuclease [Candidatus Electrothrix rattekaaiensis]
MQAAEQELFLTEEKYLAVEREGEERHEWYRGECFAMAGGTRRHNILSSRIIAALVERLDDTPCTPYMADFRLSIEAHQHYVYPDIMVICNESSYIADDMANNAEIVLEVLSKGTESYDRGQKFLHYQSVPLLREYILVSQEAMQVEVYRRRENGRWEYQRLTRPAEILFFETVDCSISLDKLYRSIPL